MDRNALAELLEALESRRDTEERRREERYTVLIERVVANVHQMALERRVGPVLDSQVCSPDCPEGLSCRNTAQYPANCSVRFLSPLANN
ncbi:UNVERIFIED_CONTAM: hypothetical protein FKN15_023918 [Acipenser sinensis]